jgi:general secretion pathway protein L
MADWLLLRLPRAAESEANWLLADSQGLTLTSADHGSLAEAAALAAGRRVCVLVSSADVLLTEVELPVKNAARALQVAPFALEEQLAGDIDQQHFALGRRDENSGRTQVAVVARSRMTAWLDELRVAGIQPDLLCTESSLIVANPSQAVALLDEDLLSVIPAGSTGLARCVPADQLADSLSIALDGTDLASVDLLMHVTPEAWRARGAQIEALRPLLAGLGVQLLKAGLLPWLALQLATTTPLNLLQGAHQVRHSQQDGWRRWRVAAGLALVVLLLQVASQGYSLWQLRRAETQVDASLSLLGEQLLPGSGGNTGTLRRRVQERLAGQVSGGPTLLSTLQSLAGAISTAAGSSVQALSFRDGSTELKLQARDAQALESINQSLRGAGWRSELVAGSATAAGYEGRIQIKSAGGKP